MAGIRVTVCLPPEAVDDIDGALAAAMAPFSAEDGIWHDRAMWDSYRILGGFLIAPGYEDDPRLIHERPGTAGASCAQLRPSPPGMCTGGPRGLLDLGDLETYAGAAWDLWHHLAPRHPPVRSFFDLEDELVDQDADIVDGTPAYEAYYAQPLIREFTAGLRAMPGPGWNLGEFERIGTFERSAYVAWTKTLRQFHDDLLTLDGWWLESHDGPRIHGACERGIDCACRDTHPFPTDFDAYLAALPAEIVLVKVRCHG
ncbi:hypothetical protein [Kitasatospora sp. NPDC088346]|uniref:hypothetical protein n=1 Tax=Kitasatospora sp. NPDC088346 TaxID=3364073 RepID=UPI0038150395